MSNEWTQAEHALKYLGRQTAIPHRQFGEETLLAEVCQKSIRILDLGCGDGRLLGLLLVHCPSAHGLGLDVSETMLDQARHRFAGTSRVTLVHHDLNEAITGFGVFDVVASSFAIHHCSHDRKRSLYSEIWQMLAPGGVFCNLEHVASPTEAIHHGFLKAMNCGPDDEDPSNQLLGVQTQLLWLREVGFTDVDCYWKWRELALMLGRKPSQGEVRPIC